jgi:hypothetical protein
MVCGRLKSPWITEGIAGREWWRRGKGHRHPLSGNGFTGRLAPET